MRRASTEFLKNSLQYSTYVILLTNKLTTELTSVDKNITFLANKSKMYFTHDDRGWPLSFARGTALELVLSLCIPYCRHARCVFLIRLYFVVIEFCIALLRPLSGDRCSIDGRGRRSMPRRRIMIGRWRHCVRAHAPRVRAYKAGCSSNRDVTCCFSRRR